MLELIDEKISWESSVAPAAEFDFEDDSPFGLQGLNRGELRILKPECINQFAAILAVSGTREQILDPNFVNNLLLQQAPLSEEYRVVHLIEKSLWIDGRSDLVMTLTRNPHQIPDNPPPEILQALTEAYTRHPQSTIWYGVPLFSDQKNSDGLPIPLTAAEVHAEARRRIQATQQHALKWGWFYRTVSALCAVPHAVRGLAAGALRRVVRAKTRIVEYWRRARLDAKRRTKAAIAAQLERCDMGYALTEIPEHSTRLGRACEFAAEALYTLQELAARNAPAAGSVATQFGIHLGMNAFIASAIPMILSAAPIVACDPFLFIELPDEPGKLRQIGHWYWQEQPDGESRLHVHI